MFQISEFMNMPDDINFILDELGDARNDAKENEVTCQEMYNQCPSKTIMDIVNRAKKLVMTWSIMKESSFEDEELVEKKLSFVWL